MRARHSSDRALEALRALGGSATLAQVARRADLERETARRALNADRVRRLL